MIIDKEKIDKQTYSNGLRGIDKITTNSII